MLATPGGLLALAALVRLLVAIRTAVPGRDSEHYLWVADEIAAGRFSSAFETAHHPGYPALVALVSWSCPWLGSVAAGQLVSCAAGAMAVLPLFDFAQRVFGRPAAIATCFLYALGVWFARYPADCLSEGPFYLLVASAMSLLAREASGRRLLVAGVLVGLAYGVRPEGAWMLVLGVPWLWLRGVRWGVVAYGGGFAAAAVPWMVGYWVWGEGLSVTPKLAVNYTVGIGRVDNVFEHYVSHLVQLPGEVVEALGYVAAPMIAAGLWWARPWRLRSPASLVVLVFVLQLLVIPLVRSDIRFVSGYGFLMLVFAGVTWRELEPRSRTWPRWLRVACVLLAVGGDLVRIPQARRADRVVVVELGRYLGARLAPGETVATDMPRLGYFAGMKPRMPRPIRRAEILEACGRPETRFVAVVVPRTGVSPEDLRELGFAPLNAPSELRDLMVARSILAAERVR